MSQRLTQQQLQGLATVTAVPARTKVDRSFGLPIGLYVVTVALYLAFIGVMASVFMNPELAIPMVVFAGFVLMAFGRRGASVPHGPSMCLATVVAVGLCALTPGI